MKHVPVSVRALGALGATSFSFGVWLTTKACSARCYERTIAYAFIAWGVVAFVSLLPNLVGFACMIAALALATFMALVFLFAGRWEGIFPPLILAGVGVAERATVLSFYLRPSASDAA
ncbi:MAG: hypothetical protein ABR552_10610 [Actinomycetota bacterium]|nr:hypothetical protein [Actinomycetota bacterium]